MEITQQEWDTKQQQQHNKNKNKERIRSNWHKFLAAGNLNLIVSSGWWWIKNISTHIIHARHVIIRLILLKNLWN